MIKGKIKGVYIIVFVCVFILPYTLHAQVVKDSMSLWFDGDNDFVTIPYHQAYDSIFENSYTIEAIISHEEGGNPFPSVLSNRVPGDHNSGFLFGLFTWSDWKGVPYIRMRKDNWWPKSLSNETVKGAGCTHIAVSGGVDNEINYYINGQLKDAVVKLLNMNLSTDQGLLIGVDITAPNTTAFHGHIKEVRLWTKTRTPQQISDFSNRNLLGNEEGLIGYWKLNEVSGQRVLDYSPVKNHGYLGADSLLVDDHDPQRTYSCSVNDCSDFGFTEDSCVICPNEQKSFQIIGDTIVTWFFEEQEQTILSNNTWYVMEANQEENLIVKGEVCHESDTIQIIIQSKETCFPITVYELVTPNGDMKNDIFRIKNIEYFSNNVVSIYNIWGQEVYRKKAYNNTWEAKELPDGRYYYIIELEGIERVYHGDLFIKR